MLVKCRYKYCPYGGKVDKEVAVKDGNMYYHKQCWQEKEEKSNIRKTYKMLIDKDANDALLNKVINNIIHNKGISTDYLLYVVKYIADNNMEINTPMGLYFYIKSQTIYEQYQKIKIKQQVKQLNPLKFCTSEFQVHQYDIPPRKTWVDILK